MDFVMIAVQIALGRLRRRNNGERIMNWKTVAAAAALAGIALGSVMAADGTHDARIGMMKQIGGAAGSLSPSPRARSPMMRMPSRRR